MLRIVSELMERERLMLYITWQPMLLKDFHISFEITTIRIISLQRPILSPKV